MKYYIKKLLRESLMVEEYDDSSLYGYHVTSKDNIVSIRKNGLNIGHRAMQGRGLYGFYSYDHAVRYAGKGEVKDPVIVKFYVKAPNRFLYLNMEIAKEVLGDEYHLMTQIENYFYGGFDEFYGEVLKVKPGISREEVISKIEEIELNNTEMKQRTFLFSLIPKIFSDKLNIVWNGNYGLEFRINNTGLIKVVGYDVPNFYKKGVETYEFDIIDDIPTDSRYDILRDFFRDNPSIKTFDRAYGIIEDIIDRSRNNRDYDHGTNLLRLLKTLK
jgi:hypothetical protein